MSHEPLDAYECDESLDTSEDSSFASYTQSSQDANATPTEDDDDEELTWKVHKVGQQSGQDSIYTL